MPSCQLLKNTKINMVWISHKVFFKHFVYNNWGYLFSSTEHFRSFVGYVAWTLVCLHL